MLHVTPASAQGEGTAYVLTIGPGALRIGTNECRSTAQVSSTKCQFAVPAGSPVIVHALPDAGYALTGWLGDCYHADQADGACHLTASAKPLSISAKFEKVGQAAPAAAQPVLQRQVPRIAPGVLAGLFDTAPVLARIEVIGPGAITMGAMTCANAPTTTSTRCDWPVARNAKVTFTGVPAAGYRIEQFLYDCYPSTQSCTRTTTKDLGVGIKFGKVPESEKYLDTVHLAVALSPGTAGHVVSTPASAAKIDCSRTMKGAGATLCSATVPAGALVELKAVPVAEAKFDYFSGGVLGCQGAVCSFAAKQRASEQQVRIDATFTDLFVRQVRFEFPYDADYRYDIRATPKFDYYHCEFATPNAKALTCYATVSSPTVSFTANMLHRKDNTLAFSVSGDKWGGPCKGQGNTCTLSMAKTDDMVQFHIVTLP